MVSSINAFGGQSQGTNPASALVPECVPSLLIWPVTTRPSANADHVRSQISSLTDEKRERTTHPASLPLGSQRPRRSTLTPITHGRTLE